MPDKDVPMSAKTPDRKSGSGGQDDEHGCANVAEGRMTNTDIIMSAKPRMARADGRGATRCREPAAS